MRVTLEPMPQALHIETTATGIVLAVKVVPGSSRDAIAGQLGGTLKIKVSAPPEGGKANRAVCNLLAKTLGAAIGDVQVISGRTQPNKRIAVAGVDSRAAMDRLKNL